MAPTVTKFKLDTRTATEIKEKKIEKKLWNDESDFYFFFIEH